MLIGWPVKGWCMFWEGGGLGTHGILLTFFFTIKIILLLKDKAKEFQQKLF